MKKMIVSILGILVLSLSASAREEVLSVTDNDDNNEVYKLVVDADDNTDTLKKLFKDTYLNNKLIKREVLNPLDLKTKNGVILEKRDGHNVLNLKSDNFDYDRGGRIIIDTLYSGVSGDRKSYDLELAKDKTGWKLFKGQKAVSKFHVKVNKVIIVGAIGIKTIVME